MCLKSRHPSHHVKASIYLTRPRALADINAIGGDPHSQVVKITRKNMHHYVNGRPSDLPLVYKQLFYDLYTTYKVKSETVLPFALLHLECTDYNNYEVRLFSHDMRTISFQDDASIISQLTLELNQFFSQIVLNPQYLFSSESQKSSPCSYKTSSPSGTSPLSAFKRNGIQDKLLMMKE